MDFDELTFWAERLAPRRPEALDEDDAPEAEEDDGWPAGLGLAPDAGRPDASAESAAAVKARIDGRIEAAKAARGG